MQNPDRACFRELVDTARQYCALIDHVPLKKDWLQPLAMLLPRLHAAVATLHEYGRGTTPPENADFDDRFQMFTELRMQLGDKDLYWLEFDDPGEPVTQGEHRTGSLADDLTDIYFDLKRGLDMLESTGADEVAELWESGYRAHWGQHLVDAERHLYSLRVNNQLQ